MVKPTSSNNSSTIPYFAKHPQGAVIYERMTARAERDTDIQAVLEMWVHTTKRLHVRRKQLAETEDHLDEAEKHLDEAEKHMTQMQSEYEQDLQALQTKLDEKTYANTRLQNELSAKTNELHRVRGENEELSKLRDHYSTELELYDQALKEEQVNLVDLESQLHEEQLQTHLALEEVAQLRAMLQQTQGELLATQAELREMEGIVEQLHRDIDEACTMVRGDDTTARRSKRQRTVNRRYL